MKTTRLVVIHGLARLLPAAILLAVVTACGDYKARVAEGYQRMSEGRFDEAFEQFQLAYRKRPREAPRLEAGMGMVLSLRRASQGTALRLLARSVDQEFNDDLFRELTRLRVDAGLYEQARNGFKREKPERLAGKQYDADRKGIECIADPSDARLKTLAEVESNPDLKTYYRLRCLLAPGWRKPRLKEAAEELKEITKPEVFCDVLAAWPPGTFGEVGLKPEQLDECRKKFPGSLALHRETPLNVQQLGKRSPPGLFPEDPPVSPYPDGIPDWASHGGYTDDVPNDVE